MKKIILLSSIALVGLLSACDDDYSNQFNIDAPITDVKNSTFTLLSSDYPEVAGLAENQELALSKDPETGVFVEALNAVGTNKYFTDNAPAEEYLPAYLNKKFPNADLGSKFTVTFNQYQAPAAYLADFTNLSVYDLTDRDYKAVWGSNLDASYLSPSTLNKIPALLSENVKDAAAGDMKVVNYAYSDTEPSTGGNASVVYQQTDQFDGEGVYVIAAKAGDGKYYPFGKLKAESYTYGYMYPAPITVTDGIITEGDGAAYTVSVQETTGGYALKNTWEQYLYMAGTYNSFNVSTALPSEGGAWKFNKNADGTYSIVNVLTEKTVKLNLYNNSYSYGAYPSTSFEGKIYLSASMAEEDGFVPYNVSMEGVSYVWKHDASYGYWKASTFVNSTNYPSESFLVSPEIDLTDATNPQLSFDGACRFFGTNPEDFLSVQIAADYEGNAATATWTELDVPNWSDGNNWDFYNSGVIDLSPYKGQKVHIAFKYVSTSERAATWEIKNVLVQEKPNGNYWDVCLFKEVAEGDAAQAMGRAAASIPNASRLYVYNGTAWSEYENADARVAVVDPTVYASLGTDVITSPETVLPVFLSSTYPYAVEGDRASVIYNKKADTPAVSEFTYSGVWTETSTSVPTTVTFAKEADGISANTSVYLSETFLGSDGGFTIQNVSLGGLSYVWSNTALYGWKASAFSNNTNNTTESWIVSPAINFKKAVAPVMTFDEAHRYLNGAAPTKYFGVMISTDYKGDVTTSTWTTLEVPVWSTGETWDFVNIGTIDLSAYNGKTVYVAFKYSSDSDAAATWEVKNLKIYEEGTEE